MVRRGRDVESRSSRPVQNRWVELVCTLCSWLRSAGVTRIFFFAAGCVERSLLNGSAGDSIRTLHYQQRTDILWAVSQTFASSEAAAAVQIYSIDPHSGRVAAGAAIPNLTGGYGVAFDSASQWLHFMGQDCGGVQSLASINLTSVLVCQTSSKGVWGLMSRYIHVR